MSSPLRIVFFGTPDPACHVLTSLMESPHEIVGVISQPDRRRGRGSTLMPTPVKQQAIDAGLPVFTPETKQELISVVDSLSADVGIVVAYGRILSQATLDHFPQGCLNVHYSLLPRWRGAAPVERAILSGDSVSGVSIMQLTAGLDEGPLYASREIDIKGSTTSLSLFQSMNAIAGELLLLVLDSLNETEPSDQLGEPTYAAKLDAEDFYVDAQTFIDDFDRKVRAGALVKGAWTRVNGNVLRFHEVGDIVYEQCTSGEISRDGTITVMGGYLTCTRIQSPGKPVMDFSAWANGIPADQFPMTFGT